MTMPNTIYTELDPFFETIGLLSVSSRLDETRREIQNAFAELGMDGENFYSQHMKIFDRYVRTFQKHRVKSPEDAFFFNDDDSDFFMLLLTLLNQNRERLASISGYEDALIKAEIADICKALYGTNSGLEKVETLDDIVLFLDETLLTEQAKWKILHIMHNPKPRLQGLVDAIQSNLGAFKKAESEVKKPLLKLLDRYRASVDVHSSDLFRKFRDSLSEAADVYPTLIFPLSQMMFENNCYYGLLSDLLLKSEEYLKQTKETLLLKLKALSDGSKLAILCSLKVSPKYNLEIAGQLGLTAATMSHHMSVLLTCGFVGVEKREGKVYYHIEQAAIRQFIDTLEQTLL